MCCYNNVREKWIIGLVLVAALFSLGVAVPMILISYPGNECLLFVRLNYDYFRIFCTAFYYKIHLSTHNDVITKFIKPMIIYNLRIERLVNRMFSLKN